MGHNRQPTSHFHDLQYRVLSKLLKILDNLSLPRQRPPLRVPSSSPLFSMAWRKNNRPPKWF